jgi:hypothetical protein
MKLLFQAVAIVLLSAVAVVALGAFCYGAAVSAGFCRVLIGIWFLIWLTQQKNKEKMP